MKTISLKPLIPLKPIDYVRVKRTVEESENIIQRCREFKCTGANSKEYNKTQKILAKAKFDLYVLRRQAVRRKNREDKAAQIGFWAPVQNYYYIPKAVNYDQLMFENH